FCFTGVARIAEKRLERRPCFHAAIADGAKHPESPGPRGGIRFDALDQALSARWRLRKIVDRELHFDSGGAHAQVIEIQRGIEQAGEMRVELELAAPGIHAARE